MPVVFEVINAVCARCRISSWKDLVMHRTVVRNPLLALGLLLVACLSLRWQQVAGATPLPIADGQTFVVKLTTLAPPATTGRLVPACDSDTRHRIEQIQFQLAF